MNSEELEQSLRTEFENYLNDSFSEMRSELTELQAKVVAEIEKHKQQLETVFQDAMRRVPARKQLDAGFKDSVLEHLRLARDEGASITAKAIAEAEEMERESEGEKIGFAELRKAIDDISSKSSQSEILKTLVHHAEMFAPRGAFFIVKNEHFVGWKTFGAEKGDTDETVRDIFFPISSDSILSQAARTLSTVESFSATHSKDVEFLGKLHYGSPSEMYAIPLVARGRGVAVLYADTGKKGAKLDTNGLETLIRVASLTVEVLASSKGASKKKSASVANESSSYTMPPAEHYEPSYHQEPASYQPNQPAFQSNFQNQSSVQSFDSYSSAKEESYYAPAASDSYSEPQTQADDSYSISYDDSSSYDAGSWNSSNESYPTDYSTDTSATNSYSTDFSYQPSTEPIAPPVNQYQSDYQVETHSTYEAPATESFDSYTPPSYEKPASTFEYEPKTESHFSVPSEPVSAPAKSAGRSRFSDRNVDLPIEVTEDERRLHNDARRFARLLVSEIKLYNEAKVKEGRESNDLYERLREAIDRSREMYDKRVQPNVAAKFDYFHYELVNSLGEGDASKLGDSYPGATV